MEEIFHYLIDLSFNNNKKWFDENKERFLKLKQNYEEYLEILIAQISEFDPEISGTSAKKSIYRIYRDARFSKDKTPYKTNFGASISREGKSSPFASYFMHIEPGNSFVGGGIYSPSAPILKAIRSSIYDHHEEFSDILEDSEFKRTVGGFWEVPNGKLKRAPKGYTEDFELIDVLKNKHYITGRRFSDEEMLAPDFTTQLLETFEAIKSFNHFLNQAVEDTME